MTPDPYTAAITAIDQANAADPNREQGHPKELLYGRRMSAMLERYAPDASEVVRLAVRAQHIERWKTPRTDYPPNKQGYLQWRTGLYRFHAATAARLLTAAGYDVAIVAAVEAAIGKRGIKSNADTQLLEDVAALVFLEHYLAGFAAQHPDYDEARWLGILGKTWRKMSGDAHAFVRSGGITPPAAYQKLLAKLIE